MERRRSYDCLIPTMGFPMLVRWHLSIKSEPWFQHQKGEYCHQISSPIFISYKCRDHSVYVPSQWESMLQCDWSTKCKLKSLTARKYVLLYVCDQYCVWRWPKTVIVNTLKPKHHGHHLQTTFSNKFSHMKTVLIAIICLIYWCIYASLGLKWVEVL